MKRPWSKFFWRDWQGDIRLRGCSLAARGLWMEMLAIMAQADRYGYLATNGKPIEHDQLARLIGADNDTVKALLNELTSAGVPSVDGDTLYSRRMVREMDAHLEAVDAGRLGGNPNIRKKKIPEAISQKPEAREPVNPTLNHTVNPTLNPSGESTTPHGRICACLPEGMKPPTIETVTAWARAYGIALADHEDIIAADLSSTPPNLWAKDGLLRVKYAIANAADRHQRMGAAPRISQREQDMQAASRAAAESGI